jgi:hypothetical protein
MSTYYVTVTCISCDEAFQIECDSVEKVEEYLRFPVAECPTCRHAQTLIDDEEWAQIEREWDRLVAEVASTEQALTPEALDRVRVIDRLMDVCGTLV